MKINIKLNVRRVTCGRCYSVIDFDSKGGLAICRPCWQDDCNQELCLDYYGHHMYVKKEDRQAWMEDVRE